MHGSLGVKRDELLGSSDSFAKANYFFTGDKTGGKGGKTEKQDSKDSKLGDEKGKAGKTSAEQEEKPPPLPSAYDEDLMLRAAMYGVLFQAYADKVSYYLNKENYFSFFIICCWT